MLHRSKRCAPDSPVKNNLIQKILTASGLARNGKLMEATSAIQRALTSSGLSAAGAPVAPARSSEAASLFDGFLRDVTSGLRAGSDGPPASVAEAPAEVDAAAPAFVDNTFTGAAGTRAFKLFEPAGFGGRPLPLLVMLHGCTQSPDDFAAGTRMNELAQAEGFFVLYPAQAPRSNAHKCWNWFVPGDQRRGQGEPSLIAGMTRHVVRSHPIDPARVYVAGLSAGGAMAAILAREYPDLFAAAGIHSGVPAGAAHDVASAFAVMKAGPATATSTSSTGPRPLVPAGAGAGDRLPRRCRLDGRAGQRRRRHPQHARQRGGRDSHRGREQQRPRRPRAFTARSGAAPAPMPRRPAWPSNGPSTAPRMPGRAAPPRAPTPTRRARMRRARCCAFSANTRAPPRVTEPAGGAGRAPRDTVDFAPHETRDPPCCAGRGRPRGLRHIGADASAGRRGAGLELASAARRHGRRAQPLVDDSSTIRCLPASSPLPKASARRSPAPERAWQRRARLAPARRPPCCRRSTPAPTWAAAAPTSACRSARPRASPCSRAGSSTCSGATAPRATPRPRALAGAEASWHDARVVVAAETANQYVGLRACEALLAQARLDADSRAETARLTGLSMQSGFESRANAALTRASAAQGLVNARQQGEQCDQDVKALVALTGIAEPDLRGQLAAATARLPEPAAIVVPSVPAAALAQRPDVFARERDVVAASADVASAEAARLPRITLAGSVGAARFDSSLGTFSGTSWSIGPVAVSLPLFDAGARRANVAAARARYDEAASSYAATLRGAIREVENALIALQGTADRSADAQTAADNFEVSFRATEARYRSGFGTLFELEDARRSALAAQNLLIDLRRERVAAWIALYRALGGGWPAEAARAQPPPTCASDGRHAMISFLTPRRRRRRRRGHRRRRDRRRAARACGRRQEGRARQARPERRRRPAAARHAGAGGARQRQHRRLAGGDHRHRGERPAPGRRARQRRRRRQARPGAGDASRPRRCRPTWLQTRAAVAEAEATLAEAQRQCRARARACRPTGALQRSTINQYLTAERTARARARRASAPPRRRASCRLAQTQRARARQRRDLVAQRHRRRGAAGRARSCSA